MPTRTGTAPPRTLADLLRRWPDEQLAALLELRPDLAVPAPADSAHLASRATTRSSLMRALDVLDTHELAVLEAVASAGPVGTDELAGLVRSHSITAVLETLTARLLVWDDGRGLRVPNQLAELVGVPPGPDRVRVPDLLAELDQESRAMLDHLVASGSDGRLSSIPARVRVDTADSPAEHLLARGLLVARDAHRVTVPWSVRLALHDGRSTAEPVDRVPELALTEVEADAVDRQAAGAAFELVRRVEVLLERWGTHPPAALRGGGLGVRDLRATAALWNVDEREAALLVETAAAAGLLATGNTDAVDTAWLPTVEYDAWVALPPAQRWLRLAQAWLDNPRDVAQVGPSTGSATGTRTNALSEGLERSWLPSLRRDVLAELLGAGPHQALAAATGEPALLARLHWRRPRRAATRDAVVLQTLAQARVLGLTGRGALSSHARALLSGRDATPVLAGLMPTPVDHVLVQADLTAIAPGPLESELSRDLGLLAEVESRGAATVYRFTAGSVRRALDVGWTAAEVHDFLTGASRTPVPQALTYLVDDVARRFGTVRVGRAECFLRSDDETALTALLHDAGAASLGLRRIAPTVLVSEVPLDVVLPRLRELGQAPVVEAPNGTLRVARPDVHRARPTRRQRSADARARARTAAVVGAIRAGDRAAANRPSRGQVSSPADVVSLLRSAAESGDSLLLGYVGSDGTVSERLVRPLRVDGGRLTAYDERTDDERQFALHRITAATTR